MINHLKIFLFVIGIIIFGDVNSQDFGYTVSADSVSWQELNAKMLPCGNSPALSGYHLYDVNADRAIMNSFPALSHPHVLHLLTIEN